MVFFYIFSVHVTKEYLKELETHKLSRSGAVQEDTRPETTLLRFEKCEG